MEQLAELRPLTPGPPLAPGERDACELVGATLRVVGLAEGAPVFRDVLGREYLHVIDPLTGAHTFVARHA